MLTGTDVLQDASAIDFKDGTLKREAALFADAEPIRKHMAFLILSLGALFRGLALWLVAGAPHVGGTMAQCC